MRKWKNTEKNFRIAVWLCAGYSLQNVIDALEARDEYLVTRLAFRGNVKWTFSKNELQTVKAIRYWYDSIDYGTSPGTIQISRPFFLAQVRYSYQKYFHQWEHAWAFDEIGPMMQRFLLDKTDEEIREIGLEIRQRREQHEKTVKELYESRGKVYKDLNKPYIMNPY